MHFLHRLTAHMGSAAAVLIAAGLPQALAAEADSGEFVSLPDFQDLTSWFAADGTGNPGIGDQLGIGLDTSQFGGKTAKQWIDSHKTLEQVLAGYSTYEAQMGPELYSDGDHTLEGAGGAPAIYNVPVIAVENGATYEISGKVSGDSTAHRVKASNVSAGATDLFQVSSSGPYSEQVTMTSDVLYLHFADQDGVNGNQSIHTKISVRKLPTGSEQMNLVRDADFALQDPTWRVNTGTEPSSSFEFVSDGASVSSNSDARARFGRGDVALVSGVTYRAEVTFTREASSPSAYDAELKVGSALGASDLGLIRGVGSVVGEKFTMGITFTSNVTGTRWISFQVEEPGATIRVHKLSVKRLPTTAELIEAKANIVVNSDGSLGSLAGWAESGGGAWEYANGRFEYGTHTANSNLEQDILEVGSYYYVKMIHDSTSGNVYLRGFGPQRQLSSALQSGREYILQATQTLVQVHGNNASASGEGFSSLLIIKLPGTPWDFTGSGRTVLDEFNQNDPALTDTGARGPELFDITQLTGNSDGTFSVDGDTITVNSTFPDTNGNCAFEFTTIPGVEYEYKVEKVSQLSSSAWGFSAVSGVNNRELTPELIAGATGPVTGKFRATGTSAWLQLWAQNSSASGQTIYRGVSIKPIKSAFDERGAELVDSGAWDLDAGVTDNGDGSYTLVSDGGTVGLDQTITTEAGATYELRYTLSSLSGIDANDFLRNWDGSTNSLHTTPEGTIVETVTASGTSTVLQWRFSGVSESSDTATVSNISVKQVIYPSGTNATFASNSDGWIADPEWTPGDGSASANNASGSNKNLRYNNACPLNQWYMTLIYVSDLTSGRFRFNLGGNNNLSWADSAGWHIAFGRSLSSNDHAYLQADDGTVGTVTFAAVLPIPASIARMNYAQFNGSDDALSLALPARRNLLVYSNDFTNAAWANNSIVTPDAISGPFSGTSGTLITRVGSEDRKVQTVSSWPGTSAIMTVYAKAYNGNDKVTLLIRNGTTSTNIATQIYTITDGEHVGDGWYRISLSVASGITSGDSLLFYYYVAPLGGDGEGIYFYGAQAELGSTATEYQSIGADWLDDMSITMLVRTDDNIGYLLNGQGTGRAAGNFWDGSSDTALHTSAGSPTVRVDGSVESPSTRDALHTLVAAPAGFKVVTLQGLELSLWTEVVLGYYSASSSSNTQMDVAFFAIHPTDNGEFDYGPDQWNDDTAIVSNAFDSDGVYDASTNTLTHTATASHSSYPRLRYQNIGIIENDFYFVRVVVDDDTNVAAVRFGGGSGTLVPQTGPNVYEGVVQAVGNTELQVHANGGAGAFSFRILSAQVKPRIPKLVALSEEKAQDLLLAA